MTEREQFETWWTREAAREHQTRPQITLRMRWKGTHYDSDDCQVAWETWQVARATLVHQEPIYQAKILIDPKWSDVSKEEFDKYESMSGFETRILYTQPPQNAADHIDYSISKGDTVYNPRWDLTELTVVDVNWALKAVAVKLGQGATIIWPSSAVSKTKPKGDGND